MDIFLVVGALLPVGPLGFLEAGAQCAPYNIFSLILAQWVGRPNPYEEFWGRAALFIVFLR